jgi:broad specificity phosphatase PhoE
MMYKCYWSEMDGNGTITWSDADITPNGAAQAVIANSFWAMAIAQQKIPSPQSYYTSPLSRCLETAKITFAGLDLPSRHPFIPEVKELFRESIGVHTCDRRRSKTFIHENYPTYTFEAEFAENDPLWNPIKRETDSAEDARSKVVLDDVFSNDSNTYISITSHSGTITSILRGGLFKSARNKILLTLTATEVIGHRDFGLNTGAVIPVLVKAETVDGTSPTSSIQSYTTVSTCATAPPKPT